MKIKKISKYPLPHSLDKPKNPIILEILGNKNWYSNYVFSQNIYQEAGVKENIMTGVLGALILLLSGYSLTRASQETGVTEEDIMVAQQDRGQIEQARNILKQLEKSKLVQENQNPKLNDSFLTEAFDYIGKNEGIRLQVYLDTKGLPHIGIGHKILPNEDFSNGITIEKAKSLFSEDIQEHLNITKRLFPKFDSYPNKVKIALLDGVFRGEHKREYQTTALINKDMWAEAAEEYLRNQDYYESLEAGTGVHQRMQNNAKTMAEYGQKIT